MSSWPLKCFGDVCDVNPRLPRGHSITDDQMVSFVPMAAVSEVYGTIVDSKIRPFSEVKKGYTHFMNNDVLFAKITPCMENGKAAIANNLAGGLGFGSTEFHVLRSKGEVLPEWLFYYIRQPAFRSEAKRNFTGTAGQQRVPTTFLSAATIPVPPLPEQRRIVDLLSRAEGIVRLRQEAEKKASELIPALFLDMFGDPATNPKKWPVESFGKHAAIPSVVRTPDLVAEADVLCMGADSIESMSGKLISLPTVREVLPKSGKYWFDAGDVLYSKIRPYLAKATLAITKGYCSADMYPLRCGPTLRPLFLLSLLLSRAFTEYATAESVRASMPKLNRDTLFKYQFPLPPVGLQEIFTDRAEAMQAIQNQQSAATIKAQATFDALLAQAFSPK
jgi:type I restriction enzyme, S subunit